MEAQQAESLRQLLCQLGTELQTILYKQQTLSIDDLSSISRHTEADTIYRIDKISEELILDWLERKWPPEQPVQLVMEGIEDKDCVTFPPTSPLESTAFKLIIDPIDGTRGLMYNKRAGWALIGLAPQKRERTSLADIFVAVMTELPTSKQYLAEQLSATRYGSRNTFHCTSRNLISGAAGVCGYTPSQATDLKHGFASVAKYFPQAKAALALFEEELYSELIEKTENQDALIFDDQYISTGGQLYELIAGHDRFVLDIRPLAYRKLGLEESLSCHPYDLCTALVAQNAGVIIETPLDAKLSFPLDTTSPVSWVGYANAALADRIRPVLDRLIRKHFL